MFEAEAVCEARLVLAEVLELARHMADGLMLGGLQGHAGCGPSPEKRHGRR